MYSTAIEAANLPTYANWAPRDRHDGESLQAKQEWLVCPVVKHRDSGALDRANYDAFLAALVTLKEDTPDGEDLAVEAHEVNHWAYGWIAFILVYPGSKTHELAAEMACALADYPVVSDNLHSEYEQADANETWTNCYNTSERIAYIRKHRSQFKFRSLGDLMGCVRGKYFAGYASELLA